MSDARNANNGAAAAASASARPSPKAVRRQREAVERDERTATRQSAILDEQRRRAIVEDYFRSKAQFDLLMSHGMESVSRSIEFAEQFVAAQRVKLSMLKAAREEAHLDTMPPVEADDEFDPLSAAEDTQPPPPPSRAKRAVTAKKKDKKKLPDPLIEVEDAMLAKLEHSWNGTGSF